MRFQDLTNKKFGRWFVLYKASSTGATNPRWRCRCDCGTEANVLAGDLKAGKAKQCRNCYIPHNSLPSGKSNLYKTFRLYKRHALNRSISFNLSIEQFEVLTKLNCNYCNALPSNIMKGTRNNGDYLYNGVDRIDNSIGYIESNCVSCCRMCNRVKSDLSKEKFLTWVERVYKHSFQANLTIPS